MNIRTRFSISADGYVTTPDGWPSLVADPAFVSGQSHGFPEFQKTLDAVLMGRTTFEPAIGNPRWPWPDLDVFVLALAPTRGHAGRRRRGQRPAGASWSRSGPPTGAGTSSSSAGRRRSRRSVRLGALDKLGLLVLPILFGDGMRLTDALSPRPS